MFFSSRNVNDGISLHIRNLLVAVSWILPFDTTALIYAGHSDLQRLSMSVWLATWSCVFARTVNNNVGLSFSNS